MIVATGFAARGDDPWMPKPGSTLAEARLDPHEFKVIERESGSVSYYKIVEDPVEPFLRAVYRPPLETVVVGVDIGDDLRAQSKKLRWKWRAMALPIGANECKDGLGDSSASVYVAWKRWLKIYSLKFVWSTTVPKGTLCLGTSNLFLEQATVVLESGPPLGTWISEEIDLATEFRQAFADGDPSAPVPELLGLGVMSDGDQTHSLSAADYGSFTLLH